MTKTLASVTAIVLLSACVGVNSGDQPTSTIADDHVAGGVTRQASVRLGSENTDSCGPTTAYTLFR
jgi:hypothetical protein